MSKVIVKYTKVVTCDVEVSIEVDLEKNNISKEELGEFVNSLDNDLGEVEDYLLNYLDGDYLFDSMGDIYEQDSEIENIEIEG